MKILFCCKSFDNMAGGIERQATYVMNEMAKRGHEIHLLTFDRDDAKPFYEIDNSIRWKRYSNQGGKLSFIKRLLFIRRYIAGLKPCVAVGFQHAASLPLIEALLFSGIPVVASERMSLASLPVSRIKRGLFFPVLSLASKVTVQFKSYINDYPPYIRRKITVVPNAIFSCGRNDEMHKDFKIIAVGRLSFEKDFDVLIEAFSILADEFPEWNLEIAGEGPERQKLDMIIKSAGLQNRVSLIGAIRDINERYDAASVFCISSRWEGFPNVLAEAMSHGLPCVGFAECTGVRDLIENGKNGLLADGLGNAASLADCLRKVMSDKELRVGLGKEGVKSVGQYSPEKVFDLWENLFSEFKTK